MAEFPVVASIISIIVTALFLNWAARIVADRSTFLGSIVVAVVGTLLAGVVFKLADGGTLGIVLAVIAWAAIAAVVYRTSWAKGAVIGVVAWILWALVRWLVEIIF